MQKETSEFLGSLTIGRKQSYKNMELYPLLTESSVALDYLTLDEALSQDEIDIMEMDKGASVPELRVVNNASLKILILDGEELIGAKQNRIVNTTILIQEKSTVVIPVSCVEQGRWAYDSPKFSSEERVMPSFMRARKAEQVHRSVRESGKYRTDQGEIWEDIAEKAARMDAASPTMEMRNIFNKARPKVEEYLSSFRVIESQVGALVAINGKIVGMDCLGKRETFAKISPKLAESYVLDAVDWLREGELKKIRKHDANKFLDDLKSAAFEEHKGVQLGTDCRIVDSKCTGFSFLYENQVLHMSFFPKINENNRGGRETRMQRFSSRRRNRAY